jgi:hypothetical protein
MFEQPSVPPGIAPWRVRAFVRLAIDLDAQLGGFAIKVEVEFTRWMLVSPFQSTGSLAERLPH